MKDRGKTARSGKRSVIKEQFMSIRQSVRESYAWQALPDSARRLLDRLELEFMRCGRTRNGALICTYDDFHKAGIRRASIALAIRQCVALGFLEVTEPGRRSAAGMKFPSRYRLTYSHARWTHEEPTDEWKSVRSMDDATHRLNIARETPKKCRSPPPTQDINRRLTSASGG
jgi:hypothetical protein